MRPRRRHGVQPPGAPADSPPWSNRLMDPAPERPTRRASVAGTDLDGRAVVLAATVARKLYRCPGCGGSIEVGAEHVLVRIAEPGGDSYHQHWHGDCARAVRRELADARAVRPDAPARRRR